MLWWALVVGAGAADGTTTEFYAGSYGRVQAGTNLAGGGGDAVQVASHGPRIGLDPYLELDLGWKLTAPNGATYTALVTPALSGELFHYDGEFGDELALRNLFVEADNIEGAPLAIWAGSRMYRGDDVYLLDFWPLDNLNTYGGGVRYHPGNTEVAAHVGVNRLREGDWQFQDITVATPDQVDGETVVFLDRQRTITSLKASQIVDLGELTFRARVYGEYHALPWGKRRIEDEFTSTRDQILPPDSGSVIGAQLSLWGWAPQSYVHLWLRRSSGLASFGELSVPVDGLADDYRAAPAESWMVALAGNQEFGPVGLMWGGYASASKDADGDSIDFDDRRELVGVVRPTVYATDQISVSVEGSVQRVIPNGPNPRTDLAQGATVTELSLLPGLAPDRGGFTRPRLQLIYTATFMNDGARGFYSPEDARVLPGVRQFVGIGAEWWVNSTRPTPPGMPKGGRTKSEREADPE